MQFNVISVILGLPPSVLIRHIHPFLPQATLHKCRSLSLKGTVIVSILQSFVSCSQDGISAVERFPELNDRFRAVPRPSERSAQAIVSRSVLTPNLLLGNLRLVEKGCNLHS